MNFDHTHKNNAVNQHTLYRAEQAVEAFCELFYHGTPYWFPLTCICYEAMELTQGNNPVVPGSPCNSAVYSIMKKMIRLCSCDLKIRHLKSCILEDRDYYIKSQLKWWENWSASFWAGTPKYFVSKTPKLKKFPQSPLNPSSYVLIMLRDFRKIFFYLMSKQKLSHPEYVGLQKEFPKDIEKSFLIPSFQRELIFGLSPTATQDFKDYDPLLSDSFLSDYINHPHTIEEDIAPFVIDKCIALSSNINGYDAEGYTPIMRTASQSDEVSHIFTKHLIQAGADLTALHAVTKGTLLHFAKNAEILELIVQSGKVNVNAQDKDGDTPLHIATREENFPCIQILLQAGAQIDIPNKYGVTPLKLYPLLAERKKSLRVTHQSVTPSKQTSDQRQNM